MKVLHLYSDWKWTGPAEPALEMVTGLRREGVDAQLALTPLPFEARDTLQSKAVQADVPLHERFFLKKHFNVLRNLQDIKNIAKFLKTERFDLVHAHRHQDHFVGGIAASLARVPLVRSSHDGVPLGRGWRNQLVLKKFTNLYLPVSQAALEEDQKMFDLEGPQIFKLPPAIDTQKFSPENTFQDMRGQTEIPQNKILVGIVARMQRHRRFQELLESWAEVARLRSNVHFTIIGRGTNMNEVAVEPAKKLGLQDRLTFAGYHRETYIDMLQELDIKIFLVPGSDGSCRALRQALSLGIPAVGARRGMIPEIIQEGETGYLVEDSPQNLTQAILKLIDDNEMRKEMGEKARKISVEKLSLKSQSEKLISLYQGLLK